eukprot:3776652-Lingulodinium_polyedra.AAC.1
MVVSFFHERSSLRRAFGRRSVGGVLISAWHNNASSGANLPSPKSARRSHVASFSLALLNQRTSALSS